ELGWTYLGKSDATLTGTAPQNVNQLLSTTADLTKGGGNAVSLALRYRYAFTPSVFLNARAGGYGWRTRTVINTGSGSLDQHESGGGFLIGAGPGFVLCKGLALGLNFEYDRSTRTNYFEQATAALEYRF
ncbi:MAG: hypothetical protein ACRETE_08505, partial [Stenotrophobium sp.]